MLRELLLEKLNVAEKPVSMNGGRITLADNRVITDFLSQYGANPFGGIDDGIRAEAIGFLSRDSFAMCQPLQSPEATLLKSRLTRACDMRGGTVVLSQSGTEAVETAVKVARTATGRPRTVALTGGFHGKTQGAVQLTGSDEYRRYFRIDNSFVDHLDINDADVMHQFKVLLRKGTINALMLEMVQGEGGMLALPKPLVQELAQLCRDNGVLLIVDEVQTGFGRTGTMFAFERYGITPDIVVLAKAMGGGLVPISAIVCAAGVCPPEFSIFNSSTFANNEFTSFVASRFLETAERLQVNVAQQSEYFDRKLAEVVQKYPDAFSHSSGLGFMRGLHIRPNFDPQSYTANFVWNTSMYSYSIASWMFNHQGILTMPCFSKPSCLRLQPPLTADQDYLDDGLRALRELGRLLESEQAMSALLMGTDPDRLVPKTPYVRGLPKSTSASGDRSRRFVFNLHPLTTESQTLSLPSEFAKLSHQEIEGFKSRIVSLSGLVKGIAARCYDIPSFRFDGREVSGQLYGINLTAEDMMVLTPLQRSQVIDDMAQEAKRSRADVVGLGAFTSVIAMGGLALRGAGKAVTSGSSLTAYAAVEAALGQSRQQDRYGVIGAMGSIGALVWQMLLFRRLSGDPVSGVTLFLNPTNDTSGADTAKKLQRIAHAWIKAPQQSAAQVQLRWLGHNFLNKLGWLEHAEPSEVMRTFQDSVNDVMGKGFCRITTSNDMLALHECNRVMVATNSPAGLSCLEACQPGATIFDIGMPSSIPPETVLPHGVTVLTSGILHSELEIDTGTGNIVGLPPNVMLGCFAETVTLAATDLKASPLRPMILLEDALSVGALAERVGMRSITDTTLFDAAPINLRDVI